MSLPFPPCIGDGYIDFHLGRRPVKLRTYPPLMYRQLVCWCLVQRFWYYVLDEPKCSDFFYDKIERFVFKLERKYKLFNIWSPTKNIGSSSRASYPMSVIRLFEDIGRV